MIRYLKVCLLGVPDCKFGNPVTVCNRKKRCWSCVKTALWDKPQTEQVPLARSEALSIPRFVPPGISHAFRETKYAD